MRNAFTAEGISPARAHTLALIAVAAIEGGLIIARANRDAAALETIAIELEAMIDAALPD